MTSFWLYAQKGVRSNLLSINIQYISICSIFVTTAELKMYLGMASHKVSSPKWTFYSKDNAGV